MKVQLIQIACTEICEATQPEPSRGSVNATQVHGHSPSAIPPWYKDTGGFFCPLP